MHGTQRIPYIDSRDSLPTSATLSLHFPLSYVNLYYISKTLELQLVVIAKSPIHIRQRRWPLWVNGYHISASRRFNILRLYDCKGSDAKMGIADWRDWPRSSRCSTRSTRSIGTNFASGFPVLIVWRLISYLPRRSLCTFIQELTKSRSLSRNLALISHYK